MARGSASYQTGQKDVTSTPTLLVPARPGRITVVISPMAAVDYYVGKSDVSTTNGLFAGGGAPITLDTADEIWAVSASNVRLSFVEYL